jgi:hypothetical protein
VVLILLNLLLELINRNLLVLNDQVDLELLDTETDGNKRGSTPDKTLLLNSTDVLLHLHEVGLVICKIKVRIAA